MSGHLSALDLDELAVSRAASPHVDACADCRARLVAVQQSRQSIAAEPEFQKRLARLEALREEPARVVPFRRRALLLAAAAVPLAAGLLLFVVTGPSGDGLRLKGLQSIEVLSEQGEVVVRTPPGRKVAVVVGGAGHTHAVVFAVDAAGAVSRVWPADANTTRAIASGARVRLEPAFEVTPGSVALYAFFTDQAEAADRFERALHDNVEKAREAHQPLLDTPAPSGAARTKLEVR